MADESDLDKTEQPSARRLEKAREEGQVARSREAVTFALLATALGAVWASSGHIERGVGAALHDGLAFTRQAAFDPASMVSRSQAVALQALVAVAPVLAAITLAAVLSPMLLGGLVFAPQSLGADFSRIDPLAGMARMFSTQSLADLLKALAKALLVGSVGYFAVRHSLGAMSALMTEAPRTAIPHSLALVATSCAWIVAALLVIAALDVPYQLWALHHKLRMSKQDLKQEHKESEGDPHTKARIKRQQKQMATRRMMASVPKADLVLTNPSHYAVALRYDERVMSAPRLVAKGSALVAQRIRQLAREHGVEVVESPALARSLFRFGTLEREIPAGLYTAVAEVLAWVYQLRRWRAEGGVMPAAPQPSEIPPSLQYAGPETA